MTAAAALPSRLPSAAASGGRFHYRLQPGLALIALAANGSQAAAGGILQARRPLMAMRLNAAGFSLIEALARDGCTAEEAASRTGVPCVDAAAFLDGLAARRLVCRTPVAPVRWPAVTIIVAARGRPLQTRACARSLLALDYPGAKPEIIIVDDASVPPLAAALAGLPVRLLRLDRNVGQSAARNLAAADATGEILAFIDNDCTADRDWLRTLISYFAEPAVAIVGGRVLSPPAAGTVAAFEAVRSPLDMGAVAGPVGPAAAVAYLPTCNFLVRRDVFASAGGFAAEMRVGEDVDLCWRLLASGWQATYAPAGTITHHHRVRLGALLRRRADYGASEGELQNRHPGGRRVLPLPVTSLLLLAVLTAITAAGHGLAAIIAFAAAALLVQECAAKHASARRLGAALPLAAVAGAVVRAHGAALWSLSGSLIRYYGLPMLAMAVVMPQLVPAVTVLLLVAPVVDYRRHRPALPLAAFVVLYWLEMAAYQIGVWRGCCAARSFHPLFPLLKLQW